jgi:hypothetical protein
MRRRDDNVCELDGCVEVMLAEEENFDHRWGWVHTGRVFPNRRRQMERVPKVVEPTRW